MPTVRSRADSWGTIPWIRDCQGPVLWRALSLSHDGTYHPSASRKQTLWAAGAGDAFIPPARSGNSQGQNQCFSTRRKSPATTYKRLTFFSEADGRILTGSKTSQKRIGINMGFLRTWDGQGTAPSPKWIRVRPFPKCARVNRCV